MQGNDFQELQDAENTFAKTLLQFKDAIAYRRKAQDREGNLWRELERLAAIIESEIGSLPCTSEVIINSEAAMEPCPPRLEWIVVKKLYLAGVTRQTWRHLP